MGVDNMNIVGVRFKSFGNTYFFINDNLELNINDYVVVDTENGEQYAKVTELDVKDTKKLDINKMKHVLRIATKEDVKQFENNIKKAKEALEYARKEASRLELDMRILDASYTLDRKQLTFNFTSDERIDFRELVKSLAASFKTRIELHQIGVRDKSKLVGGLGQCGRPLCCGQFLSGMETISINMAKNQGLALNPTKINGLCGRLLCCLAYEDEVYTCHRKELPKLGEKIKTPDGEGKVVNLDILNKKYSVEINGEVKQYEASCPKRDK
jgi:cell fate regulator YaaT (PSP1 superfamily)